MATMTIRRSRLRPSVMHWPLALVTLALATMSPLSIQGVTNLPSIVTAQPGERRIFVRDRRADGTLGQPYALVMKGVNWSPASRGINPDVDPQGYRQEFFNWYTNDIPLMARMGVNVIRVYHDLGTGPQAFQVLDFCYQHGIKVIVPVDSPLHGVVADASNITNIVNAYKNHPAVLMWAVGNEWDINYYYSQFTSLSNAAAFTEQAAQTIKSLDANHPVATFCADPHIPAAAYNPYHYLDPDTAPWSSGPFFSVIVSNWVPSVDVWGLNLYRNRSFTDVFAQWSRISAKPMFIAEFGADAYDHSSSAENQAMQAQFNRDLWDEVFFTLAAERTSGIASGVLAFEWNDEWWKNGSPNSHTISYEVNYGQPDGYNDEEWFGLVDIDRNPRAVYSVLRDRFLLDGQNLIVLSTNPTLRATSSYSGPATFEIDGKTVYSRMGGDYGARGFNIAVLDDNTGLRMREYRHFDTWYVPSRHNDLVNYLNSLPNGSIVLLAIADHGGMNYAQAGATRTLLQSWGSTMIGNVSGNNTWAMITIKGQGVLAENWSGSNQDVTITATVLITTDANAGRRQPLPVVHDPRVNSLSFTNASIVLNCTSEDGFVYAVEHTSDLRLGPWQFAQRGIVAEGVNMSWKDDGTFTGTMPSIAPCRFYRISVYDHVER